MPNHVQMLPNSEKIYGQIIPVGEILRLIKKSTARSINQMLDRKETIWHREYYDHWFRNQEG